MSGWLPSDGIIYTKELEDIITSDGSIAVLAGAGSGKTELLAQKADYLFSTGRTPWPKRILSLTFKREAQFNIGKRIEKRCNKRASRFDSYTFHAFAKSIVDRFGSLLPEQTRPTENYDIVEKNWLANGISKLTMNQVIDLSVSIVRDNDNIRAALVNAYSHVFVDEFQDTTDSQYLLIKLIFHTSNTRLLCVGDINQSIMLWAGAQKTVFNDFLKDFGADKKFLLKNYRCSTEIQSVLSIFLEFMEGKAPLSVNKSVTKGCLIKVYRDEVQEARYITDKIEQLIGSGVEHKEICVLTKQLSSTYTQLIRDSLSKRGINNLDMSDLQDSLKEPVGEIFSLYAKFLVAPEPSITIKLHDLYLSLNNIVVGDEKEEKISIQFYNFIHGNIKKTPLNLTVDDILAELRKFFLFIGFERIKGRWKQYQSQDFLDSLWTILETHLRDVFIKSRDSVEAVSLFTADNAVQVMNIHKCKGLEYKAVFFVGLEDQAFWNYKKETFENNCAIYVALSRAKEFVELSYTQRREHRAQGSYDNRASTCNSLNGVYNTLIEHCKLPIMDLSKSA